MKAFLFLGGFTFIFVACYWLGVRAADRRYRKFVQDMDRRYEHRPLIGPRRD